MALDNALLYNFVKDAVSPYSEDFRFDNRANPTEFHLNGIGYSAHVSYVHDSGNSRDNDDEVRIQIGRALIEEQRSRAEAGKRVAFLGFFEGGEAFVAWDPRHVFSLQARTVVSVYARQSQLTAVRLNQAAVHQFRARFLEEQSFAIALPAEALGFYLENIEHFHRLPTEEGIVGLMRDHTSTFTESGFGGGGDFNVEDSGQRERFTYERKAYPRDPRFKRWVLDAYEQTCCVCDRQLGLIEAAHIIPHSVDGSPNEVSNGLALCIEHHRLYDRALLLPGPGRRLVFNDERAEYLKQTNQQKGLEEIEALNGNEYRVPESPEHRPNDEYLAQGLEIRMAG
ncbi:HNH endonuclease [Aliiroseovarius sp. YM-037]|uniref:HNH endonuclease n=1 Tax=Aliiroseovarius sp. YM-037 TaxID=3341728 RepID=UPI003A7FF422